jgi:hypothetical protein
MICACPCVGLCAEAPDDGSGGSWVVMLSPPLDLTDTI